MKELENLKELYLDEIKKINKKGELNPADAEAAKKALEAIEKINEICEESDEMEEGYSKRYSYSGYSRRNPSMSYHYPAEPLPEMVPMTYSMARSRDSMGRYSREGGSSRSDGYSRGNSYNSYSRNDGYSRHYASSKMIEKLEEMLENAPDERKRMAIERCISEIEGY